MKEIVQLMDCPECGKKFELIEFNADGRGWEAEKFGCPHDGCKYESSLKSSGYFETRKPSK